MPYYSEFRRRLAAAIVALLATGWSGALEAGPRGLPFLKVGVGGAAVGLGEAYTALASGALATYWNPAGLAVSPGRADVALAHAEWLESFRAEYLGVAVRTGRHYWGMHVYSNSIDGIPMRQVPSDVPLGMFGSNDLSAGLSYATRVRRHLAIGGTVKYLYQKIFVESAAGTALDIGAQYTAPVNGLVLALVLKNWGSMSRMLNTRTELPILLRYGGAYHAPWRFLGTGTVLLTADYEQAPDAVDHVMGGIEIRVAERIAGRVGYQRGFEARSISGGFGLALPPFLVDYGFTPLDADLGNTHRFSLGFRW